MLQFQVENFQSLEKASITVKGLTLIIGQSNQGKSATLRALKAACTNKFKNGQVRQGEDHALVKIKVPDSQEVLQCLRPWNGSIKYKLGNQLFTKVGRTIPKQINDFLNLGTIDAGGEMYSLNFHDQFQPPLLLVYSQNKVMEILSASEALADLKEAKDAISLKRQENKGAIASVQAIKDDTAQRVHELEDKVAYYKPLVDEYCFLYDQGETVTQKTGNLSILEETVNSITRVNNKIVILDELVQCSKEATKVDQSITDLTTLESALSSLSTNSSKQELLYEITQLTSDNTFETLVLLDTLDSHIRSATSLCTRVENISNSTILLKELVEVQSQLDDRSAYSSILLLESHLSQLAQVESRINELSTLLSTHTCPFCGSTVKQ